MAISLADAAKVTPCYNAIRVDGQNGFVAYPTDGGLYAKFPGASAFEFVPLSAIVSGKLTYTPVSAGGATLTNAKLSGHHGGN